MNVPAVQAQYNVILHRIRWVLAVQQYVHWARFAVQENAVGRFDEWWQAHTSTIVINTRQWALDILTRAIRVWGPGSTLSPKLMRSMRLPPTWPSTRATIPLPHIR
jgi:hypothetical protein